MVHACCDDAVRPCLHNDWDDVRTRKGLKVLRCRVCQGRWKLPSGAVYRCMAFLHDNCFEGERCLYLHVRRTKSTIYERYELFGERVLEGVADDIQAEARSRLMARATCCSSDSDDEGPPELLDEEVL